MPFRILDRTNRIFPHKSQYTSEGMEQFKVAHRPQAAILIVSDEPTTGNLWGAVLKELNVRPLLARTAEQAVDMLEVHTPDLIVVDISLRETNAVKTCAKLFEETAAPIMLLTPISNESHLLEAYRAGVDECVIKPISPTLFAAKIKVLLRRSRTAPMESAEHLKLGDLTLDSAKRELANAQGKRIRLTSLESRVLAMLMSHPDYPFSSEDIVRRIWGFEGEDSSVLVKNVIYRLRKKVEPNPNQPQHIRTETGGYLFRR